MIRTEAEWLARERELLEANNRYLQEARDARSDARGLKIAQARLGHIDRIYLGAIDNLLHHQRQLDADGIEVGVSRQALNGIRPARTADTIILARQP
mgnify:CR=1 FL=1